MKRFPIAFLISLFLALVAYAQEPQAKSPIRFNFETGDLQGWKVTAGQFGPLPSHNENDRWQGNFNKEGKYFIGTCELGDGPFNDGMTGRIRSPIFTITAGKITLLVGGGNHPDETYIALYRASAAKELFRETGRNAEAMDLRTWDVSQYKGTPCYIEIVDEAAGSWGHINVDDIREMTPDEEAQIAREEEAKRKTKEEALAAWRKSLFERGSPKVYKGEELSNIAMPMGGIGAGSIALRGNGALREWQIFNNCDKSALLPYSFFAVWAKKEGGQPVAKLLQTDAIGPMPGIADTEFSGEYPMAWISYKDKNLPVDVRLECYSPMIPLNPKDSAIPGVVYTFSVKNPSAEKVAVSLAASLENGVGYDGHGKMDGVRFQDFCGNTNAVDKREKLTAIAMKPTVGSLGRFDKPLRLFTSHPQAVPMFKLSENLRLDVADPRRDPTFRIPSPNDIAKNTCVVWLGDLPGNLPVESQAIDNLCEAVRNGASLFLTGQGRTLLTILAQGSSAASEVFDDFESGTYKDWTIEGEAFGKTPSQRAMPGKQGKFFAFSFPGSDVPKGKLTSKPFTIQKKYIHFLLGGGRFPKETCFNLNVDGKVVRSACGEGQNIMRRMNWNVAPLIGKEATLEILDDRCEPWGSIFVDDIRFSDSPELPLDASVAAKARELLPIACQGVEKIAKGIDVARDKLSPIFKNVGAETLHLAGYLTAKNATLKSDAKVLLKTPSGEPLIAEGTFGKGRVLLCLAPVENSLTGVDQKTLLGNMIAYAASTGYTPPTGVPETSPTFGSMTLATLADNPSCLTQWDDPEKFWKEFSALGAFADPGESRPSPLGSTWNGAIATPLSLAPGEEKTVTFLITWHFPNHYKCEPTGYNTNLGNMYCSWFKDAGDAAGYLAQNFDRLSSQTKLYHDTLYDTTLPRWIMDLVSSQSSIIRTQTLMWLAGDVVAGYEGCGAIEGCCPMNCTHVYNYEQSLAHLFPSLERNMRLIDLKVQLDPKTGLIHHRTNLPLTAPRGSGEAIDGQLGTVLKAYRDHLRSPDRSFLDSVWPQLQAAMNFVFENHDQDADGVIEDRQFNTYDCAVYGPNTFIGTLYLGALRAMEEMAKSEGNPDLAKQYRDRFERGRARLVKELWNGEYFIQKYDEKLYPDCEYGAGCFSDQLLGQWYAHVVNLGYVLPEDRVKTALASVFKYNWLTDFASFKHSQRVFASGEDKGLLVCSWPKGGRPEHPILYCDEVWTGIEYQVVANMIWEGLIAEAFQVAKGARDRYNGVKRNPWNDIECGDNYARAMSSWSVLLALEGFIYDGPRSIIGFTPRYTPEDFRAYFSGAEGWGTFTQKRADRRQTDTLDVKYGRLTVKELVFALPENVPNATSITVSVGGATTKATFAMAGNQLRVALAEPVTLAEDQKLEAEIAW